VLAERGVVYRPFAAKIARRRLRFLHDLPQAPEPDAAGYKGFFYRFLDIETGRRVWQCELSTIDSAFLLAGMLTVAAYFDRDTADYHLTLGKVKAEKVRHLLARMAAARWRLWPPAGAPPLPLLLRPADHLDQSNSQLAIYPCFARRSDEFRLAGTACALAGSR
jgi:hypothetical protein